MEAECARLAHGVEVLEAQLRKRGEALDAAEHQLAALGQDNSLLNLRIQAISRVILAGILITRLTSDASV